MPVETTANYVRIRVASPSKFIRMRVKTLGKGIRAIVGFKKEGGSEIQSILFPRARYTLAQAKAWVSAHNYHIHESFLINDINLVKDNDGLVCLDFNETLITPEMENELLRTEKIDVSKIKKETWEWMFE
jgi:hypothetical protein